MKPQTPIIRDHVFLVRYVEDVIALNQVLARPGFRLNPHHIPKAIADGVLYVVTEEAE